jgi:hypothetical protein
MDGANMGIAIPDHPGSLEVGQRQDVEELGPGRRWKGVQPIAEHLLKLGDRRQPEGRHPTAPTCA